MGVISTNRAVLPVPEDLFPIDYLIESPITTEDEESAEEQQQIAIYGTPRRRRAAAARSNKLPRNYAAFVTTVNPSKKPGNRKQRRLENSRLLMSLIDADDLCDDFSDMLPDSFSAFSQLFLEADKMKAWNAFIQKTEEEQLKSLHEASDSESEYVFLDEDQQSSSAKYSLKSNDRRQLHPAYSGPACFRRISKRMKTLLTHKHVPLEKLENFERVLTEFFVATPDGVFVLNLMGAYDRLLAHAVAQYLNIQSRSYGNEEPKHTQFENRSSIFVPPNQTLSSFLRERHTKRLADVSSCT